MFCQIKILIKALRLSAASAVRIMCTIVATSASAAAMWIGILRRNHCPDKSQFRSPWTGDNDDDMFSVDYGGYVGVDYIDVVWYSGGRYIFYTKRNGYFALRGPTTTTLRSAWAMMAAPTTAASM